jgi:FkbH-like protein
MNEVNNPIKLVIWDLDETFWEGTLSEEGISIIEDNLKLVKELSKRGIVNSICSKNDFTTAQLKLKELDIWEFFVFPKIDWVPKGQTVKSILSEMGLRAENTLFIDDNLSNLKEVLYFNPKINIIEPHKILELWSNKFLKGKDDRNLTRLIQYKSLEIKTSEKKDLKISNLEFLSQSEIKVNITKSSRDDFDRILELIERTNQLNFTQIRIKSDELEDTLRHFENFTISVQDKYGDYGIVGFISHDGDIFRHFLFSCRTINMRIEVFILKYFSGISTKNFVLDLPDLNLDSSFIILSKDFPKGLHKKTSNFNGVLLGSCDLEQTIVYFSNHKFSLELNYANSENLDIRFDHSSMILDFYKGYSAEIKESIESLEFMPNELKTNFFNEDNKYVVFSLLSDYSRGLYKHKELDYIIAYDHYNLNLTNANLETNRPPHLKYSKSSFFETFQNNFDYLGPLSPEMFKNNITKLCKAIYPKKLFVINGAEINKEWNSTSESKSYERHVEFNNVLDKLSIENLDVIDIRNIVTSQNDVADNIRHYQKNIYLKLAKELEIKLSPYDNLSIANSKELFIKLVYKLINRIKNKVRLG